MSTRTHLGFQLCVCVSQEYFIKTKIQKYTKLIKITSSTTTPLSETPCCYGSIRRTLTPLDQTPSSALN